MDNNLINLNENKKEYSSISIMRLLMAYLIVCIHVPYTGELSFIEDICWIATPFFMVTAGFFAWNKDEKIRRNKMAKHFGRTVFAYIAGYTFYFLVSVGIKYFCNDVFHMSLQVAFERWNIGQFFKGLILNNDPFCSHLWFLYCLAIVYIVMYFFCYEKLKEMMLIIIMAVALCFKYGLIKINGYEDQLKAIYSLLPMFYLGYYYHYLVEKHREKSEGKKWCSLFLMGVALFWVADIAISDVIGNMQVSYNEYIAIAILIILIKYPEIGKGTIFERIGKKYTLDIYVYHIFVMHFVIKILEKMHLLDMKVVKEVEVLLIIVLTVIFAVIKNAIKSCIVRLFKKNKKEIDNKA